MKVIRLIIWPMIFGIILMIISSSCVSEPFGECGNGNGNFGHTPYSKLVINVRTVTPNGTATSDRVKEKIKSVRFIMLCDGEIKANIFKSLTQEELATDFVYTYEGEYLAGNKEFIVLANEESVNACQLQFGSYTLPSELAGLDLSGILNYYKLSDNAAQGQELKQLLNALNFDPNQAYAINDGLEEDGDENPGISNSINYGPRGDIYLPYSVYYSEKDITDITEYTDNDNVVTGIKAEMYLVPIATKFEFHFTNKRLHDVEVSGLSVTGFDNLNYLLAQVGASDLKKKLPGEKDAIYWPDWLAKVAEKSWNYSGSDANLDFSNRYGWIGNYSIPEASSNSDGDFTNPNNTSGIWTVPGMMITSTDSIAGTLNLGPYYIPESWRAYTYTDPNTKKDVTIQRYGLNMRLHDTSSTSTGNDPVFSNSDTPIENIGALFRNTHVVINIIMSEGESGVYAQIEPWTPRNGQGYVGGYKP